MENILHKDISFSEQELEELRQAAKRPIVFDDECPEVTPEQAKKFKRVNPSHKSAS